TRVDTGGRDGRGSLHPRDAAQGEARRRGRFAQDADLRDRRRRGCARRGTCGHLSELDRERRLSGEARTILREGRRALQGLEGLARVRRLRGAERAPPAPVLAPRFDLLPKLADLPRAGSAATRALGVPVRAEDGRLPVSRQLRDGRHVERRIRADLEEMAYFAPHRSARTAAGRYVHGSLRALADAF